MILQISYCAASKFNSCSKQIVRLIESAVTTKSYTVLITNISVIYARL